MGLSEASEDSNTSPDDDEPPPLSAPESQTVKDNPASTAVSESIEKVTSRVDEVTLTSEKVTSKVEEVTLTSIENNDQGGVEVPLPTSASDDDEFHEASESPDDIKTNNEEEFNEKENDEKMEKEFT